MDIVDGQAIVDTGWSRKQPDWSLDPTDSGRSPVERLAIGGSEPPQ